ncbi:helix-turn-helix domain-containing protein [Arthrobacter psychrolactophilus]
MGALTENDPWLIFHKAIGMLAYAQALNGQLEATQLTLARLEAHSRRGAKFHEVEGFAYAAAAIAIAGEHSRGVNQLRELLRECQDRQWLGLEVVVLSLLIRLHQSDVVPRLGEVAELIESGHQEFLRVWAAALSSEGPLRLAEFSTFAFNTGFELLAAEAAIIAQRKFQQNGKLNQSQKAAQQVASLLEHMPGLVSPVFTSPVKPKLTRREHEIASLVARGDSNSAIATTLGVSMRTIEGHLYRTFIKLDCQSREQLAVMMKTQATPENAMRLAIIKD